MSGLMLIDATVTLKPLTAENIHSEQSFHILASTCKEVLPAKLKAAAKMIFFLM